MIKPTALDRAAQRHQRNWGPPEIFSRAPGRVNLIGEHTDYNDGFVLPMALPFDTAIAASRAPNGSKTEIFSEGFGHAVLAPAPSDIEPNHWTVYLHGVHDLLIAEGINPGPWKATIATDIPAGAGLSSSAALEVAVASTILCLAETERSPAETARLCQRVDNEIVGIPSGLMDQMISASAVAGHASLIDCRSLQTNPYPLPDNSVVAIMDTKTRRQLVDSAYSDRQSSLCQSSRGNRRRISARRPTRRPGSATDPTRNRTASSSPRNHRKPTHSRCRECNVERRCRNPRCPHELQPRELA